MPTDIKQTTGFMAEPHWLTGQLLVAMPSMPDPRFARTVIYVCSHNPGGAMGIVINRLFGEATLPMLLSQLNIPASPGVPEWPVLYGGPVEPARGFVLHSGEYTREGTMRIDDHVCLSATVEVVRAMAEGNGPERSIMALGYSGWGAGQLDDELKANGWITAPADEDILFDRDLETKWTRALARIGISPTMLSVDIGHA
jgi:putative transcriptional regulator